MTRENELNITSKARSIIAFSFYLSASIFLCMILIIVGYTSIVQLKKTLDFIRFIYGLPIFVFCMILTYLLISKILLRLRYITISAKGINLGKSLISWTSVLKINLYGGWFPIFVVTYSKDGKHEKLAKAMCQLPFSSVRILNSIMSYTQKYDIDLKNWLYA